MLVSQHGSALEDAACSRGIAISWDANDKSLGKLSDAVSRGPDSNYRQGTKVRVTGQIRRVARSAMLNEPYWELRASSAQ